MFKSARKFIFILICVFGLLIAFNAAAGGHLFGEIVHHIEVFIHTAHLHGPHFRNPIVNSKHH